MNKNVQASVEFLENFTTFARHLISMNLMVGELWLAFGAFKSWTMAKLNPFPVSTKYQDYEDFIVRDIGCSFWNQIDASARKNRIFVMLSE